MHHRCQSLGYKDKHWRPRYTQKIVNFDTMVVHETDVSRVIALYHIYHKVSVCVLELGKVQFHLVISSGRSHKSSIAFHHRLLARRPEVSPLGALTHVRRRRS